MANKRISDLPSTQTTLVSALQDTDRVPVARGGSTYHIVGNAIKTPILDAAYAAMLTKVNSLSARDSAAIDLTFNSNSYALSANVLPGLIHNQTQVTSLTSGDEFLVWTTSTSDLRKIAYENFGYDKSKLCASIGEARMTVSSYGNSFFIMQDGTLRACGVNRNGAIGTGRANNEKVTLVNLCAFSPVVSVGNRVTKVVTNYDTSFAITSDGKLYGTGYNGQGQLGLGDVTARFVFTQIVGGSLNTKVVTDIQAGTGNNSGSNSVHVLTQDGLVYAFGDGTSGSLGFGTTTNVNSTPQQVTIGIGSKIITQILTLGGGNNAVAFALANDGTVWSAGDNDFGQLGRTISTASDKYVFKQITTLASDPIVKLWGSGDNANSTIWARGTSGKIYGWGYNGTYKAVGNNSASSFISLPVEITDLAPLGGAYIENIYGSVDTNSVTLFAKYTNGTIKSWGRNYVGQLGTGNNTAVNSPTVISGWPFSSSNVKDIAVAASSSGGNATTAILLNDGTIYTAGYGGYGTLGNGISTPTQRTFEKVLFDPKIGTPIQIIMGNHDTANEMFFKTLLNNGKVLAWGYQTASTPQLGTDATPNSEYTPVQVLFF